MLIVLLALMGCATEEPTYDLILRGGTVYDGSGFPPRMVDVAIAGDRIVAIGDLDAASGAREIDVSGLAVAPGFINMLSWATESLFIDGRGLSDIVQGVTLEVMGEGWSLGPLNESMRAEALSRQDRATYDLPWTTLGEALEHLESQGVSPNIASFVGATTVRIHELGYDNRAPTPDELARMRELVRTAMEEGAMGVGSSLIYAPAAFADTAELTALSAVAGEYGGMYISHLRSEGDRLLEALDELITIARDANVAAEVYHLKAAGQGNWHKLDEVVERIEAARAEGLAITTDMYLYTAGATGLNATMPPWVQEGGHDSWVARLRDPAIRARVIDEMRRPGEDWENFNVAVASADDILLAGFRNEDLTHLIGKTVGEVAAERGVSPEEAIIDLVIEDDSRVDTVFFLMSEENVERQIALPYMSFGSDGETLAPEGVFLDYNPHPRAYGNVARLLGHYVRDRGVIPLEEAIRRLTAWPASNLKLRDRGRLQTGFFADVVVFDPATIQDHATFEEPHQLATGVVHVFVNGEQVLRDGEHTGATPGRVVRGPGWVGWSTE
ncbi:MAG: D-aminoacylase [Acidobacteriota bacterium]